MTLTPQEKARLIALLDAIVECKVALKQADRRSQERRELALANKLDPSDEAGANERRQLGRTLREAQRDFDLALHDAVQKRVEED